MKTLKLNKKTLGILLDHQMRSVRGGGQLNTTNESNDPSDTDTAGGDTGCASRNDTDKITSLTTNPQSNPPNACLAAITKNKPGG